MSIRINDFFSVDQRVKEAQQSGNSKEDLDKIILDLRRFYPPTSPLVPFLKSDFEKANPVTMDSPLHLRLLVEFFAESFKSEAQVMYARDMKTQFSAFRRTREYEAWIVYKNSTRFDVTEKDLEEVRKRDNVDIVAEALGCCFFNKNPELSPEQKKVSEWVGSFAWIHPFYRRTGALKSVWGAFDRYGEYWLDGPLSEEMKVICENKGISKNRIISSA